MNIPNKLNKDSNYNYIDIVLRRRYYSSILQPYYFAKGNEFQHNYFLVEQFFVEKFDVFNLGIKNALREQPGITGVYHIVAEKLVDVELKNNGELPDDLQTIINEIILETM